MRGRCWITVGLVTLALAGSAACSDDDEDAAPSTSTSTSSSTVATSEPGVAETTTTRPEVSTGCDAGRDGGVPVGAASKVFGDVDGDGRDDTFYVDLDGTGGGRIFGVVTSSGARSEWRGTSAAPVGPSIYGVADANEDGQPEIFANVGRGAFVLTYRDCTLEPYLEPDGTALQYTFGFTEDATGFGCIDADGDGRRDLVVLDHDMASSGPVVHWTRTIVRLEGAWAELGPTDAGTFTSPQDDAAIELLDGVSCGEEAFSDSLTLGGV